MNKLKVSAISYLNTIPFVYGLQQCDIASYIDLSFDTPSVCADRIKAGDAHIGIIPVAAIPSLPACTLISNYCIGAVGKVHSVAVFCDIDLAHIDTLYMDNESRTSVQLTHLLLKHKWNIHPVIKPLPLNYPIKDHKANEGFLLIGDKVFDHEQYFRTSYDLAEEWISLTHLPFVFANWVSTKPLSTDFIALFDAALNYGLRHKEAALQSLGTKWDRSFALNYLNNHISYNFDEQKKEGLAKFYQLIQNTSL